MESRKFRLIILAYLRDPSLIKPDYPNGVRSVLRENVLLQAVAADMDASEAAERLHIESAFACHLKPEASYDLMSQFTDSLRTYWDAKELNTGRRQKSATNVKGSATSIVKLYETLEKAGILGDSVESNS